MERHSAWPVLLGLSTFLIPLLRPAVASGQDRVRVVETVDPATGDRRRFTVQDLDHGEIKAVQAALRDHGYVGIGWTGRLDDGTRDGLSRFQRERGLVECGCVSYETIVALGLRPEVVAMYAPGPAAAVDDAARGASVSSGILYPVGIPVYVPRPPPCEDDPCEGNVEGGVDGGGSAADGAGVIFDAPIARSTSAATPPGIRPAPPPSARAGDVPRP